MAEALDYIILGIVQGLTEWLPVSSSGHMVIVQEFLGMGSRTLADALMHLGTLLAIFIYFRRDIRDMVYGFFSEGPDLSKTHTLVLVASLPIIVAGLLFQDVVEAAFSSARLVALLLIVNGIMLVSNHFVGGKGKVALKESLLVGLAQCFALMPGISRSGSTITAARWLGVKAEDAARFSFFISIIPISGAIVYKGATDLSSFDPAMLLGVAASFVVGYLSIGLLMAVVKRSRLEYFGIYTMAIGVILLLLL